jgi:hypothetical protein
MRAGGPCIEQQRGQRTQRTHNERAFFSARIDIGKIRIVACPIFCFRKNDSAQRFAALHLRRLFLLLRRLGVKRAPRGIGILPIRGYGLAARATRRDGCERAMIRDRDPRADRERNAYDANTCLHDFGT